LPTWQFVDSIASSPGLRLDLANTADVLRVSGFDLSPPQARKARTSSMLGDGSTIPASAYENRTIGLTVQLRGTTVDSAATALQNLARELDRDTNILKVQLTDATSPVFFRTFGEPGYMLSMLREKLHAGKAELEIEAEPYAIGLREDVTPVTVSNNPAAGTNPARFDVTGVKGDVETPLLMVFTGTGTGGVGNKQSVIAVRRNGDPTALDHVVQAEAMTTSTDTTVGANDAAMSGAGSNRLTISFSTNATLITRASDTFPASGTAIADARGQYRVFARVRKSAAGTAGDMVVRLAYGHSTSSLFTNSSVSLPAAAGPMMVDLGLVGVPLGHDPVEFGYSGVDLNALLNVVAFQAQRVSGALTLDLDYLTFVPADDSLCLIDWPSTDTTYAVDGVRDAAFAVNTGLTSLLSADGFAGVVGGLPMLTPNQTNRVYFLRDVTPGVLDAVGNTTAISLYYYPRWLVVRPP
jgi:hypothetical protein